MGHDPLHRASREEAPMTHPIEDCRFWPAIDAQCRHHAEPHSDMCERHQDYDNEWWHIGHHMDDCCGECCGGTIEHLDEGEMAA